MIGMASVANDYPLYYEASNEWGLSMAGLNFPGNAVYHPHDALKTNIAPFELIPWILGQCKTVAQAVQKLNMINLIEENFSEQYQLTPLHWLLSDQGESVTIEPLESGIRIYNNHVGVLTNNPPFEYHMYNLSNYINLTADEPINKFSPNIDIHPYSRGMGSIGLPGDMSSASRFIKATFVKQNSISVQDENASISQFFHILSSVAQQEGCVKVDGRFEKTIYSSCCNVDSGVYYYTTYENNQITGINMHHEDLDSQKLITFPLIYEQQIKFVN